MKKKITITIMKMMKTKEATLQRQIFSSTTRKMKILMMILITIKFIITHQTMATTDPQIIIKLTQRTTMQRMIYIRKKNMMTMMMLNINRFPHNQLLHRI